jgi:hypothetical protein
LERGFISTKELSRYTLLASRKNELGNVDMNLSLRHLLAMCPDFLNEEGMMEHKLGVEVILPPKCHAKIAGEGLECMWACIKGDLTTKVRFCWRKSFQSNAFESSQDEHEIPCCLPCHQS